MNVASRTLAVLLIVFAVNHMDRQLLALLIEPIKGDLGLSDAQAGVLYGFAFAIVYSLIGVPIARYADRANRVNIITASLVAFSVMTALCGAAVVYWQLLLARLGVGVGEAGTSPASHSLLAQLYPLQKRSSAMAVFAIGPHLGVVLAFVLGGVLAQQYGWRVAFVVAGALGLIVAAFARGLVAEPPRAAPVHQQRGVVTAAIADVRRCASMRHIFIGGSVANMASAALVAWLPSFLMRVQELPIDVAGLVLAGVLGVLGGVGVLCGGVLADRLGRNNPGRRLQLCAGVHAASALLWPIALLALNPYVAYLAMMCAGALISFHLGPSFAMVQSLANPQRRAVTASLLLLCANFIGLGFGPAIVGALNDAFASLRAEQSVRYGLLIAAPLFLWAAYEYRAASRTLQEDLLHAGATDSASGAALAAPARL